MTLQERIAELKRLEAEATPGEWQTNAVPSLGSTANGVFTKPADDETPELFVCSVKPRWDEGCAVGEEAIANAEFIAAARNAVVPLIAAYEAALTALEASHRERVKLREQLAQQAADWAADDTAIRELCGHVDDGYTVPLVEVVRRKTDKLAAVRDHCLKHQHSGVSPGVQLAYGEVLNILEGR